MTSLAHGKAATAELSQAHVKFLGGLASACSRHSSFRASPCFQSLESSLAGLELHYEALDALQAATRDCWLSLASWSGPFVVSHGDFTPWTTQVHEAGLFVPDWDRAHTGANPLADVFHYLLAPRALSRRPVSRGFLAKALRSAQAAAQQMHPGIHWDARAVSALALAYLLDSLAAHAGPDGSIDFAGAMVKSYWRLMEQRALWMAS